MLALAWGGSGCGDAGLGSCDKQPDVSGHWLLALSPATSDAGVAGTIPREDSVGADLMQVKPDGVLSLGRLIYGTLTSQDPGFFSTLVIPPLTHNNGSKTGSLLGCAITINIPIAQPVTDDNEDQGPMRISLVGEITERGKIEGDPERSILVLDEDQTMTPRSFAWVGTQ